MKPVRVIERLDWTFHHDYEVELCDFSPDDKSGTKVYFFPANLESNLERTSVAALRIKPHSGAEWIGVFAYGFDLTFAADAIFSCPDPEKICVVCGGYSYIVKTLNPRHWERLPVVPVVHAFAAPQRDILVFGDFTRFAAYGLNGLVWISEQISWDGIKVLEVTAGSIRGTGWEAPTGRDVEFTVDLGSGEHVGGTAPRRYRRPTNESV